VIPKECKRLAEVDFPIRTVSNHCGTDKYQRYKPATTLHTWWAQRPLSACRSMLAALLLPDPCDPACPKSFKDCAREVLPEIVGKVRNTDVDLRRAMLKFIGTLANSDVSLNVAYIRATRQLIALLSSSPDGIFRWRPSCMGFAERVFLFWP
jgi:putative DNA methylase